MFKDGSRGWAKGTTMPRRFQLSRVGSFTFTGFSSFTGITRLDFCPHQVRKTEHVYTDVLAFSSTWSTISIRVPFRRLVLLKGSFCSSCCYCFMFGGLAQGTTDRDGYVSTPAAPVPADIDNIRHLKCMLRGSIPLVVGSMTGMGRGGGSHSIHLGSFGTMLKIELRIFQFLCGKPSKGSGALTRGGGIEKVLRSEQLLPAAAVV